jgi:AAA15 family ATPase/GTPase
VINNLIVKQGTEQESTLKDIDISNTTIFVGPNNSGKSLLLKEIESFLTSGPSDRYSVVNDIHIPTYTEAEVNSDLDALKLPQKQDNYIRVKKPRVHGGIYEEKSIHIPTLKSYLSNPERNTTFFLQNFYSLFTLRLDGRTRFSLTEPTSSGDLSQPAMNHLMSLFQNDEQRKEIREIIYDAIGKYFVIDPTGMTQFKIRFSERPPENNSEEQSLDLKSREFHKQATNIAEMSDGVKAFTGIITSMFASDFKVILIDEPEAFLHPPLAKKLGLRLSQLAQKRSANLLMATHSADFVMGCIESGTQVNIVRLTYNNGFADSKALNHNELVSLMKDPLLRSTGVISSLFHERVIITEADSDRSFYQEVNLRLIESTRQGVKDCLFLNAQNKQTTARIMKPLKDLGISVATILDIDVIKEGGKNWANLLTGAQVPVEIQSSLNDLRRTVKSAFDNSGYDMKRDGGISILSGGERAACLSLFSQLTQYGIFIVPFGELESWLKYLEVENNKSTWLVNIFDKMGNDPTSDTYVAPRPEEDVWKFMFIISSWFDTGKAEYNF